MALVRGDDGTIIEANDALCEMTGYQAGRLSGRRLETLYHAEERQGLRRAPGVAAQRRARRTSTRRPATSTARATSCTRRSAARWSAPAMTAYLVLQVVDVSDRKRFEGQLRRLADHDALTGLYNRRRFGEELEWIVGYAQRYGHPAALLALDVDHFSYINDSYGHATGDELLGTRRGAAALAPARHRHRRPARRRRVRRDPARRPRSRTPR